MKQGRIKSLSKETLAGFFASASEAYNMAIYAFMAPFLAPYLFEGTDPLESLIFTYGITVFAAFVAFPAGSFYFGYLGDFSGRRAACTLSSLGLAISTGAMAFIALGAPFAWLYFLVCICTQYFFSGGEYSSSIIFSLESTPTKNKSWLSGLSCLFAVFGLLCAKSTASMAITPEAVAFAFFFGSVGGGLSYTFKYHCKESPLFQPAPKYFNGDWQFFFRNETGPIVRSALIFGFFMVIYSYLFFFLPAVQSPANMTADYLSLICLAEYGVLLFAFGFLGDQVGVNKCMAAGALLCVALFIAQPFLDTQVAAFQIALTAAISLFVAPIHSALVSNFKPHARCRGVMISVAVSQALFAGTAVPVLLLIYKISDSLVLCGLYPVMLGIAALWALKVPSKVPVLSASQ